MEEAARNAAAFNDAMRAQRMASCGQFPGYSAATIDAHHELSDRSTDAPEELDRVEARRLPCLVGRGGSANRPGAIEVNRPYHVRCVVDSMMVCHGWYPCLESKHSCIPVLPRIKAVTRRGARFHRPGHD